MRKLILLFVVCLLALTSYAQQVDNVKIQASKMSKQVENVIIKPADYTETVDYPVLYLLHGYGGSQNDWPNNVPELKEMATLYQMLIVCPDGENSWYLDSPINEEFQYETYITKDLVSYVDANYSTIANRYGRAIAGLSMGGQGALYLAARHLDTYSISCLMSGGIDLTKTSQPSKLALILGSKEENEALWIEESALTQADKLKNGDLCLMVDCGLSDMFFEANLELHEKLLKNGVQHDYIVRPGNHDWTYWKNAIHYNVLFVSRAFSQFQNTVVDGGKVFFSDAPVADIYSSSFVNLTAPSELPEMTEKKIVVDSQVKYSGKNSLRLTWISKDKGNWKVGFGASSGWQGVDMSKSLELRMWVYSPETIANNALPLVYFQNEQYALCDKVKMGAYIEGDLEAGKWTEVVIPIADFKKEATGFNMATAKTLFLAQDLVDDAKHTLNIDYVTVMDDPNYQPPTEMVLFADSKDNTYYDPSWVNLTAPSTVDVPEGHAEKLLVVTDIKQEGENALRLTYTSMEGGVWKALVAGLGWNLFDLTEADYELRFWVRATETLSGDVLPVMYFEGNGGGTTGKLKLSDYVSALNADEWTEVVVPIEDFRKADPAFSKWDIVKGLFFSQNAADGKAHTLYLDNMKFQIVGGSSVEEVGLAENGMNLFYSNGSICYDGIEGNVAVYNLAGVKCVEFAASQKGEFKCSLENGVYVAVVENASRKFIVK